MTILLVDGNNILSRADYAARAGKTKMSVDGVNTSALFIFINMLAKYVRQTQPDRMAVYWDQGHQIRDRISPDYKANRHRRPDTPEDEETPWTQAREFLTWAGVAHLAWKGFEADDLIAIVANRNSTSTAPEMLYVLSGDKDLLQLVDGVTQQIRPGGSGLEIWDTDRVATEMDLLPSNIPLYMALVGDTGDNVQGVRGIGPKKALTALGKAGWDWEALLADLGPEKAEEALLARRLVDLRDPKFAAWSSAFLDATPDAPKFSPTHPGGVLWEPLLGFLNRWQLASVEQRLVEGSLWYQGQSEKPPETPGDIFAGMI